MRSLGMQVEEPRAAILLAQPVGRVAQVEHRQLDGVGDGECPRGRQVGQQHRGAGLLGRHRRGACGLERSSLLPCQRDAGLRRVELELALVERDSSPSLAGPPGWPR